MRWKWSGGDYQRRRKRTERWINIARRDGYEAREVGLIGIRADILRNEGIEKKEPGLLISSFSGTHEFRTRAGIVDREIEKEEFILIIDPVLDMVELEVEIALACADEKYIELLVSWIGDAELWCPRGGPTEWSGRLGWKQGLVEALEHASGQQRRDASEREMSKHNRGDWKQVGSLAEHAKNWIENSEVNVSLCPNRPQGIGETEEDRREYEVNERTRMYQNVSRTIGCKLRAREWTLAPMLPSGYEQMGRWRVEVEEWIGQAYMRVELDVQAIRECEGEP